MDAKSGTTRADELMDAVGPAFSRLGRSVALNAQKPISRRDLTRTRVLQIAYDAAERADHAATVGDIAERLAVDPSAASRMVSDAISAGYLRRVASQRDGRRTVVELTEAGSAMLADFRQHQREAYKHITRDWPEQERLEFARLLIKYVDALASLPDRAAADD